MTTSRQWIQDLLDAGAGSLDLAQDDDEGDEDEGFTSSDDELDESEDDESDEDEEQEQQEQEPYRPPTGREFVEAALAGDLDLGGLDPAAWTRWAVTAPPDVWRKAAADAGMPGAEQPRAHHLPDALRVGLMQQDLDARIAAAREGRR